MYDKYFGLPNQVGSLKENAFLPIKNHISVKLNGCLDKLLSEASKEVLVKVVAQAIPTYTMSVFKLLKELCSDIQSLINHILVGSTRLESNHSLVRAEKSCGVKAIGCLIL